MQLKGTTVIKDAQELKVKESDRIAVVTEGLKEGDKLIIEGNQKVSNGSKIIIK